MGKGQIISGGDDGQYQVKIIYNRARYELMLAELALKKEKLEDARSPIQDERDSVSNDVDAVIAEILSLVDLFNILVVEYENAQEQLSSLNMLLNNLEHELDQLRKATPPDTHAILNKVAEITVTQREVSTAQDLVGAKQDEITENLALQETHYVEGRNLALEVQILEAQLGAIDLEITAIDKRKEYLESKMPADETVTGWCADLTEDLSGDVGTVEVPGEVGILQIQPGYEDNAEYNQARDGQLFSTVDMTPAQLFMNLALLPGWQKWRPIFRHGTITSVDKEADTASVNLDLVTSSQQSLEINQESSLTGVEIEYMNCNSFAFDDGDEVLIMFTNADFGNPKIIGFKEDPQSCVGYCGIVGSTETFETLDDENIHEWRQGEDAESTSIYSPLPETQGEYNRAWALGSKVKIGASWEYPFEFTDGLTYKMKMGVTMIIYDSSGAALTSIPITFRYDSGFTPGDKMTAGGSISSGNFACKLTETDSGPHEAISGTNPDCENYTEYDGEHVTTSMFHTSGYITRNLNGEARYNSYYYKTDFTWVDPYYSIDFGISAGSVQYTRYCNSVEFGDWDGPPCPPARCQNPGVHCFSVDDAGITDYLDLNDPCFFIDMDEGADNDPENLYKTQSWSMEGTITEDGVVMFDTTDGVTINPVNLTSPVGPWGADNATQGESQLTSQGPIEGAHHVGFKTYCFLTDQGQTAAIISEDEYEYVVTEDSAGQLDFYCVVCPPDDETEE